jgi:hypothetical protein
MRRNPAIVASGPGLSLGYRVCSLFVPAGFIGLMGIQVIVAFQLPMIRSRSPMKYHHEFRDPIHTPER